MRRAVRPFATVVAAINFFFSIQLLQAQRPSAVYAASLQRKVLETRVRSFVFTCMSGARLNAPLQLFSQGSWFLTTDLASHVKQEGSNDDGTAMVWMMNGHPRALSVWVHDDEFDRSTLACLNVDGVVTRQINEYMPGESEPDLHWIYIHTFLRSHDGHYRSTASYTDWQRRPLPAPRLTSEDRDFIAGERHYTHWQDFDFAAVVDRVRQP